MREAVVVGTVLIGFGTWLISADWPFSAGILFALGFGTIGAVAGEKRK